MLDRPDFSAHFGTGKAISRPEKLNSSLRGLDLGIKGERVGGWTMSTEHLVIHQCILQDISSLEPLSKKAK